ncbi:MAG: hypothetical protein IT306_30330 [Chloroflexi bacterium]|nr:hypothetical protein [Chloroflexota bacterium]
MPNDFLLPLIDPTAPLPASWPSGGLGAFLLFLVPIGGGIPLGVLMGHQAGLSASTLAAMYFVSDIVMAITHEPMFWLLAWLGRAVPAFGKVRDLFHRASQGAGLKEEGVHGPLGLILFSFTVDPVSGRGAAAAAGHGFLSGWTFAVLGDMLYFGVVMAATLWLHDVLGNDQATIGVVLLSIWGLSWYIRRRRRPAARRRPAPPCLPDPATDDAPAPRPVLVHTASAPAGPAAPRPGPAIRLRPARAALPTSASIRKRQGRKRR